MAVDRALLESHAAGESPPTLRLYRFDPPTLTLGRFQDANGVDDARRREAEVDLVRRPTGGRGVLHADELTYAVIAGVRDAVPRGTAASYRHLSAGLIAAYRRLGIEAEFSRGTPGEDPGAACYLQATQADLTWRGRKLSGSAQVWSGDSVLQHGSIVRARDQALERLVLGLDERRAEALARRTATMADALDEVPSFERIGGALVEGFSEALGVSFVRGGVSADEMDRIAELRVREDHVPGGDVTG